MRTILLTWNPERWNLSEKDWKRDVRDPERGKLVFGTWSTGLRKDIIAGETVYLLRQGKGPRGIVARGTVRKESFQEPHWDGRGGDANYVSVAWESMVPLDAPLPTDLLIQEVPTVRWNFLRQSGSLVDAVQARAIGRLWKKHL